MTTCVPSGTLTVHDSEPDASFTLPRSASICVASFAGRATTVQGGALSSRGRASRQHARSNSM